MRNWGVKKLEVRGSEGERVRAEETAAVSSKLGVLLDHKDVEDAESWHHLPSLNWPCRGRPPPPSSFSILVLICCYLY